MDCLHSILYPPDAFLVDHVVGPGEVGRDDNGGDKDLDAGATTADQRAILLFNM